MNRQSLLIFDMDGVLVDVTESYRETIRETVRQFTDVAITHTEIQAAKNRGGSNNDWDLSLELIRERGASPAREEVIAAFQRVYLGESGLGESNTGLIARERWLPREQLLERLALRFRFALFTGRERWEAQFTLSKFAPGICFDPLVGMEDVEFEKPHPEGLLKILEHHKPEELFYVGDVMDDCLAARAASVPFIGVVSPENPLAVELEALFRKQGAMAVVSDINELEQVLP
jgi:HAD superfamily phosphatase